MFKLSELVGNLEVTETPILSPHLQRIIAYTNDLIGTWCKLREIHWNSTKLSTHNSSDAAMGDIMDTIDALFESIMGIEGRPGYDVIHPVIPTGKNTTEVLKVLAMKTSKLEEQLTSTIYSGVLNILNDFKEDLNKHIYLSTMC